MTVFGNVRWPMIGKARFATGIILCLIASFTVLVLGCKPRVSAYANEDFTRQQLRKAPAAPNAADARNDAVPVPSRVVIPKHFTLYASESVGDARSCVAGAVTDEDGMNQRAAIYLMAEKSRTVDWSRLFKMLPDTYQSRATHCVRVGDSLFVLMQSDTQPQQELSQTILSVSKLDIHNGAIQSEKRIEVPGISSAYSAWVDKGNHHFEWRHNAFVITGSTSLLSNKDISSAFEVRLDRNLSR